MHCERAGEREGEREGEGEGEGEAGRYAELRGLPFPISQYHLLRILMQ